MSDQINCSHKQLYNCSQIIHSTHDMHAYILIRTYPPKEMLLFSGLCICWGLFSGFCWGWVDSSSGSLHSLTFSMIHWPRPLLPAQQTSVALLRSMNTMVAFVWADDYWIDEVLIYGNVLMGGSRLWPLAPKL